MKLTEKQKQDEVNDFLDGLSEEEFKDYATGSFYRSGIENSNYLKSKIRKEKIKNYLKNE